MTQTTQAKNGDLHAITHADDSWLRGKLRTLSPLAFSVYGIVAAFATYFAMYAFRKPFAAGTYSGEAFGNVALKDALVIAQVAGYALSKLLGIRFVSELSHAKRALALVLLIAWAELALVLFGVVPVPWRVAAIFLNGLPLGAVWGLVFSFLEGRKTSELLGAGLSCSYIVASGFVKSAGTSVMHSGVSEAWMPAVTGALFLPMFGLAVWMLAQLPPPSISDEAERTTRAPMLAPARKKFLRDYAAGMIVLTVLYLLLTSLRDFRDNYAAEIWSELGYGGKASVFAVPEMWIAFGVMAVLAAIYAIKDNVRALMATHAMMAGGVALIAGSTYLLDIGAISGFSWMIGMGLGMYLAYVPFGCVLFDRMIAATGAVGTAVFMIYVADAAAYAGSVGLVLYKHFGHAGMNKLAFIRVFAYVTAALCLVGFAFSAWYFARRSVRTQSGTIAD